MNDPFVLIRKVMLDEFLKAPPVRGKRSLAEFRELAEQNGLNMHLVEDHQVQNNPPEIHVHEHDFWYCLQGEVTFTCGGMLIKPKPHIREDSSIDHRELHGKGIAGGKGVVLRKGDFLWIPAGQPHTHGTAGTARLLLLKVRA